MRKLFRMKYEPCNGQCYAYDEVLNVKNLGVDTETAAELLDRIIKIHEPACGNEQLAYTLDYDEETEVFVSGFVHYGALDLFADTTALGALNKLINAALGYYETDEYKELVAKMPGKGHDVCEHGEDHDLRKFAMKFSGLNESEQTAVLSG